MSEPSDGNGRTTGAVDAPTRHVRTFPEGVGWRIEIPSTEGPAVLEAVLDEAERRQVPIHRVSQGSGIQLLLDSEITEMVSMCTDKGVELSLFVGPRGSFDIGAAVLADGGGALRAGLRGERQLVQALRDVHRAASLGVPNVLIADVGLLSILGRQRAAGELPRSLQIKMSALGAPLNPEAARLHVQLGADSLNLHSDLTVEDMAAFRAAVDVPIDLYIEAPDDLGGFVRYHELPEFVRVAAPIYLKFGLRNAPALYPSGGHLEATAIACGRERVRRAEIALEHLRRAGELTADGDSDGHMPMPVAHPLLGSPTAKEAPRGA